ncbi:nose resistant to fluoxetine protein 6-like isoform X2 [Bacillus rossius redtenbacheri]|uniref:nose resistant to fluoxetine protein 6-like isoform X2 n=1 Tax=Bacillus rossius redtenbacheri TaxID=93214 RepID=UPI002FDE3F10
MVSPALLLALGGACAAASAAPEQVLGELLGRPFPPLAALEAGGNYSRHCADHVRLYHSRLRRYAPWALNMFDSSAKMPSGVITGSTANLGHYEQCLRVAAEEDEAQRNLDALGSVVYRWSFCVPSTCSAADVASFLDRSLAPLRLPGRLEVQVSVPDAACLSARSALPQFADVDYYFLSFIAIFALLVLASTGYDLWLAARVRTKTPQTKVQMALRAFSACTNGRALLDTDTSKDTLACVNGLRFLSICWIVFGHTYYQTSVSPLANALDVAYFHTRWAMMIVMNGTVSTDTFFLLSGALLCYVFMRDRSKGLRFSLFKFYLHRYIRLTPAYAAVVFFYASMLYHLGSGPLWHSTIATERDNCLASWWTNLLYINNYVNVANTCMTQSWYLTVDMQLYWASPVLLYPLWRWRRMGLVALGCCLAVSVMVPLAITASNHLPGAMLYATGASVTDVFLEVYLPAYTRAGPYLVGIALGYLLYATKGTDVCLPKWLVGAAWPTAVGAMAAVLFGTFGMYQEEHGYSVVEASVYAGLHRTVWAACVAWVVFACVSGYGGFVDAFLSWSAWQPLSRLTYCAFLCHFVFLLVNTGMTRTPGFTSGYNVLREMLGIMPLVLAASAAVSLVFEMPFVALDKILRAQGQAPRNDRRLETSLETPGVSGTS